MHEDWNKNLFIELCCYSCALVDAIRAGRRFMEGTRARDSLKWSLELSRQMSLELNFDIINPAYSIRTEMHKGLEWIWLFVGLCCHCALVDVKRAGAKLWDHSSLLTPILKYMRNKTKKTCSVDYAACIVQLWMLELVLISIRVRNSLKWNT